MRPVRRAFTVGMLAAVVVLGPAAHAFAHVTVTPETAAPGEFLTYTVTVPNEREDQATTEVDLSLPAGFVLDGAQQVPGWHTVIDKAADGVPTAVRWTGGRLPVGTFGTFGVQGRNPRSGSAMRWIAVQRYERTTVRWDGPATSQSPAPVVALSVTAGGGSATSGTAGNGARSVAGASDSAIPAQDAVARSRADLGLVAGGTALLLVLAAAARRTLRARASGPVPGAAAEAGSPSASREAPGPPGASEREPPRRGGRNGSAPSASAKAGRRRG
jgi:uncharacterized repeat protein (TIGR01451 family)